MFATENPALRPSYYDIQKRLERERSLVIGVFMRRAAHKSTRGLRVLVQRITRLGHGLADEWRYRRNVSALQKLDDRMLADIGLGRSDIEWMCRARLASEIRDRRKTRGALITFEQGKTA